jgi:hypothetical protein
MAKAWNMPAPCADCPFLRDGGIRLRRSRVKEIAGFALGNPGAGFACHKTTGNEAKARQCAGALIFAEKHGHANQIMRIMERLGAYDARELEPHFDRVFDDVDEWAATAVDAKPKKAKGR